MRQVAKQILERIVRALRPSRSIHRVVSRAFQEWYEMPFSPTHYYSPLPNIPEVERNFHRWYREENLAGIRIGGDEQDAFLQFLVSYSSECDLLPSLDRVTAEGYGQGYGEVEAHFLHCIIRHVKPRHMIEVGSGVSTYFSLNALEMNCQTGGTRAPLICVEPSPYPKLRELLAQKKVSLYERQVQDIDPRLFEELEAGDILFIDSSHAGKVDSDVYFLLFRVLPHLKKGVVIHVHDIPFPYLTCPPAHSMFSHSLFWNEAALLQAFLMWNTAFEVLVCQSYLHYRSPQSIKMVAPVYDPGKHFPTSLWMRKVE